MPTTAPRLGRFIVTWSDSGDWKATAWVREMNPLCGVMVREGRPKLVYSDIQTLSGRFLYTGQGEKNNEYRALSTR